jgi:hypothetical protein
MKNVASVDEVESADADLIVHEEIACILEEIIEEIFQEMEKAPPIKEICYKNDGGGGDDDVNDDAVSDEHVMPSPYHENAIQCVSQLIKYSSAHQPQFLDDLFRMYSNIEPQWL